MHQEWISAFESAVKSAGYLWFPPHFAGSEDETSLEWWKDTRNLTIFIRGREVEALQVSGPSVIDDIKTKSIFAAEDIVSCWKFLIGVK